MGFEEDNKKYREIAGDRKDFHLLFAHSSLKLRNIRALGIDAYHSHVCVGTFAARWHLLCYVVEGLLKLDFDDRTIVAEKGELMVVPAGLRRTLHSEGEVTWMWMHLEDVPLYAYLTQQGAVSRPCPEGEELVTIFRSFRREAPDSALNNSYHEIIAEKFRRLIMPEQLRPYEAELQNLWLKVREAPQATWSVAQLSRILGVSEGHLHRLCNDYYQTAPMRLVGNIRLEYGAYLLQTGADPIESVAFLCGYSSARAFSDAFQRKFKVRPGHFRKG